MQLLLRLSGRRRSGSETRSAAAGCLAWLSGSSVTPRPVALSRACSHPSLLPALLSCRCSASLWCRRGVARNVDGGTWPCCNISCSLFEWVEKGMRLRPKYVSVPMCVPNSKTKTLVCWPNKTLLCAKERRCHRCCAPLGVNLFTRLFLFLTDCF